MSEYWSLINNNYHSELPIKVNLNIKIPYIYRQEPVLYNLAYKYNLDVKILAGNLSNNQDEDGLFLLQITGVVQKISEALNYISSLNVYFDDIHCNSNN